MKIGFFSFRLALEFAARQYTTQENAINAVSRKVIFFISLA
jgi:hypothetical protein